MTRMAWRTGSGEAADADAVGATAADCSGRDMGIEEGEGLLWPGPAAGLEH